MPGPKVYGDYISTRGRSRLLGGLLVGGALASWIAVGFDLADLRLLAREVAGAALEPGRKASYAATDWLVHGFQGLLLAGAAVAFVEWLFQARANLRAFGVRRLRFRRGWALTGFLVPGLNLVRPYQVIREVWQASDPDTTDPFAWTQVRVGGLLALWWLAFIAWALLGGLWIVLIATAGGDPAKLQAARGVVLMADLCAALGLSLAYFVVEHVTEAQETKWGVSRREAPATLTPATEAR